MIQTLNIQAVVEEEYLDDGGTAYGVSIDGGIQIWATLRSADEDATSAQDHPLHEFVGRWVRLTVEVL